MMGLEAEISRLSRELGEALLARGWLAATAESCTGGGVATAITDTAGSSAWFDRGFVTYTNEAKQQMLGVSIDSLLRHGAVSEPVVLEMTRAAWLAPMRVSAWPSAVSPGLVVAARRNRSALSGLPGQIVPVVTTPCLPVSMGIAIRCASRRSDRPCPDSWHCSNKLGLILYA